MDYGKAKQENLQPLFTNRFYFIWCGYSDAHVHKVMQLDAHVNRLNNYAPSKYGISVNVAANTLAPHISATELRKTNTTHRCVNTVTAFKGFV